MYNAMKLQKLKDIYSLILDIYIIQISIMVTKNISKFKIFWIEIIIITICLYNIIVYTGFPAHSKVCILSADKSFIIVLNLNSTLVVCATTKL